MTTHDEAIAKSLKSHQARTENTVPLFWPLELATAVAKEEMTLFTRGLATMAEAEKLDFGLEPRFATANRTVIELHTLRLRDFQSRGR